MTPVASGARLQAAGFNPGAMFHLSSLRVLQLGDDLRAGLDPYFAGRSIHCHGFSYVVIPYRTYTNDHWDGAGTQNEGTVRGRTASNRNDAEHHVGIAFGRLAGE